MSVAGGCPIAGFAGDIPHLSKAAQVSYAEALEQLINQIAHMVREQDSKLRREAARAQAISKKSRRTLRNRSSLR
jgi:hypothetical protein